MIVNLTEMTSTEIPPNLKWAQNKAQLLIRVLITDAKEEKVTFEEQKIIFAAMSSKQLFSFEVNLHSKIDPQVRYFAYFSLIFIKRDAALKLQGDK